MIARCTFLFLSLCVVRVGLAQIPNPGFENWTVVGLDYEYPSGWYTLNGITYVSNVFTCQRGIPGAEGSFFARVTTREFNGSPLFGLISASANNSDDTGFPFASRPAALTGKWQYQVAAPDAASITVQLSKWNATTQQAEAIGSGVSMASGTQSVWQDFSVPITYVSPETPDTAWIIILSSAVLPTVNSTISVDALAFTGSVGIAEQERVDFSVFPSPATDAIAIRSDAAVLSAEVLDMRGRTMLLAFMADNRSMDTSALPSGCYMVRVRFADGSMGTRRFVKL